MSVNTSKNTATNGANFPKSSLSLTWAQVTRAWNSAAASASAWAFPIAGGTNIAKNSVTGTNLAKS